MLKTCECGEVLGEQKKDCFVIRKENHKKMYLYGWTHFKCPECKKDYFAKEEQWTNGE